MDTSSLVRASAERTDTESVGVDLDQLFPGAHPPQQSRSVLAMQAANRQKFEEEWPYRRFTQQDWPVWGGWLAERLFIKFPTIQPHTWMGRLIPYTRDNNAFFVYNDSAVLLGHAFPRVPDGRETILEAFALSRFAERRSDGIIAIPHMEYDKEKPLLALYRHLKEWGKRRGANRLFI